MQTAPWLGLLPGADGQILHSQDGGESPIVNLFKSATSVIVSNPGCRNPTSFHTLSKQAEAAGVQLHVTPKKFLLIPYNYIVLVNFLWRFLDSHALIEIKCRNQ